MGQKELKEANRKTVELVTKCRLFNIFPGEWASVYKGEGVEFADIKPFEPGDDPKSIDPRTLGLKDETRVIQRVVDKQLRIYIWADFSGSLQRFPEIFFPHKPDIRDIAIALILQGAVSIYSPAGFYSFGLEEKKFFPPKMGGGYHQEILNWIMNEDNLRDYTSSGVETALMSLTQLAQPRNMVFFISDFKQKVFDGDFTDLLKKTISKFDFIPVIIRDPLERYGRLDRSIRIKVRGSSKGRKGKEIYLTPKILQDIQKISENHLSHVESNFKKLGIEYIVLDSSSIDDCCRSFSNFFQTRRKTRI